MPRMGVLLRGGPVPTLTVAEKSNKAARAENAEHDRGQRRTMKPVVPSHVENLGRMFRESDVQLVAFPY